jgi:hypothetical protein
MNPDNHCYSSYSNRNRRQAKTIKRLDLRVIEDVAYHESKLER